MTDLLILWVLILGGLLSIVVRDGKSGGTLVLAYFLGLSLIHVPGALMYIGAAPNLTDDLETEAGFRATLVGLIAFVLGAWLANLRFSKRAAKSPNMPTDFGRVGEAMLWLGAGTYFILMPVAANIPSATAIVSSLGSLLPLGLWTWVYSAHISHHHRRFWLGVAILPLLPLSTMISGGFIGFGVFWVLAIAAFMYCVLPYKRIFILLGPVAMGLGLSLFIAYFGERDSLREAVWHQQAGVTDRLGRVGHMVERFEWIDIDNPEHVASINARLNQNILLGLAIERRENGLTDPAYGATVPLWAFVPRLLWPEKPPVGGSGDIVSQYTGLRFSEGTSVGVGQPLEFFINFGWAGIVVGFALLGYMLMLLDVLLIQAFRRCDVYDVLRYGLLGLALLQPGGSFIEIVVSCVGALVAASLLRWSLIDSAIFKRWVPKRLGSTSRVAIKLGRT
jgi:hypothetical protein